MASSHLRGTDDSLRAHPNAKPEGQDICDKACDGRHCGGGEHLSSMIPRNDLTGTSDGRDGCEAYNICVLKGPATFLRR